LNSARVAQAISAKGGTPAVLVGSFKNDSSEHIDTEVISKTMETAIFNSGILDFVAGGGVREELRAERADQQLNASEATAAKLGAETGADFLLTGSVKTVIDKAGNQEVRTYWVNAEMTNISTNTRMWMGENNEIKKLVTRPKNKL
jgi:PBP1b-binding outer membrane lipoprotein LpoB